MAINNLQPPRHVGKKHMSIIHKKKTKTIHIRGVYEGELMNGKAEGKGRVHFKNDCSYEGDWQNNKRHGMGKMFWPHVGIYIGRYRNDKPYGKFSFVNLDQTIYKPMKPNTPFRPKTYIYNGKMIGTFHEEKLNGTKRVVRDPVMYAP